jgi:hypothetical protein
MKEERKIIEGKIENVATQIHLINEREQTIDQRAEHYFKTLTPPFASEEGLVVTAYVIGAMDQRRIEKETQRVEEELQRMKLGACGIAAMCNTKESAEATRITKDNPYWSPSYDDVCRAVDREMKLRDELEFVQAELEAVKKILECVPLNNLNTYLEGFTEAVSKYQAMKQNFAVM